MSEAGEMAVSFKCGGDTLIGVLHKAPIARTTGILFVVGGPQYRVGSHRQFVLMARKLAADGYPSLRFDYRGMGDSEGAERSFEDVSEDITTAAMQLHLQVDGLERIVAIGLCDAVSAILMQIQKSPVVGGMILINPWVRTEASEAQARIRHYYLRRIFQTQFWTKLAAGKVNVMRSVSDAFSTALRASAASLARNKPTLSTVGYIDRMREGFAASNMPVLFLISERDLTADEFMNLAANDDAWKQSIGRRNVKIERLPGADHTFSSAADLDHACDLCLEWLAANY